MCSYVIHILLVRTRMSLDVLRMYSYVTCYVVLCHLYVTHMISYVIRMPLVFSFTKSLSQVLQV